MVAPLTPPCEQTPDAVNVTGLPELPQAMQARFQAAYGISAYDAATLTASRDMAKYFEAATQACKQPKLVANWVINEVRRFMYEGARDEQEEPLASGVRDGIPGRDVIRIPAEKLAELITRITDATISNAGAKKAFIELWTGPEQQVDEVIERMGLKQITDTGAIEALVDDVLAANQKSVEEYRAGKEKAFNALVGQAMKATKGKANPQQVTDLLKKKLGA